MRKLLIIGLLLVLTLSAAQQPNIPKASATTDCAADGQPSITDTLGGGSVDCHHIYYEGNLGFVFIQTWDPSWDYETYAGSMLGGPLYDMPVTYTGGTDSSVTGLGHTSALTGIADNGAGTLTFTIRAGIHAYEITPSTTTTPVDRGVITGADWAYSITRALAACNIEGPASAVYIWIAGANDWLNTCTGLDPVLDKATLASGWTNFTALNSITSTATTFTIKSSGDLTTTVSKFTPFLGIFANSWAAVYPEALVEATCGAIVADPPTGTNNKNLNEQCHGASPDQFFDDNGAGQPRSIGTGPYILDQKLTSLGSGLIYLRHNPNYCTEHGGAGTCDMVGTTAGPISDANRPTYIVITEVTDELTRDNAMIVGTYDHSVLSPTSLPDFLQAAGPSSPPAYNDLQPSKAGTFNFHIIPSLTVTHLQMPVTLTAAQHTARGAFVEYPLQATSPMEGTCSPMTSGCHVRRAVISAFNYASYVNNIILGLGTRLATMMPDPLPSGNTAAQANGVPLATFSTTKAVVELLAAGYHNTAKMPTVVCVYNAGNEVRARSCVQIQSTLQGLRSCNDSGSNGTVVDCYPGGIRYDATCPDPDGTGSGVGSCRIVNSVDVRAPVSSYLGQHVFKGKYDIAGLGWFPDYVDEDDYARPYFYSTGTFQANGIGFSSATVDSDINAAAILAPGAARNSAYFKIENETNVLCSCFVWLAQPSGRSVWNKQIDTHVFDRFQNPAFLPVYLDIAKVTVIPTPVFNSPIGAIILTTLVAVTTLFLLRRASPRRIQAKNTV